jgi:hypothetical protein
MHADPVAVFRAAVAVLNREDWVGAAALRDPANLADVQRRLLVARLDSWSFSHQALTRLSWQAQASRRRLV